jgi:hypothetical protein
MGEQRAVDDILLCDRCVALMYDGEPGTVFTDFCKQCTEKLDRLWDEFEIVK